MHALTIACVLIPPVFTTFEISWCFAEMMLRVLVFFTFLTEVPCQTSWPDVPLQTA